MVTYNFNLVKLYHLEMRAVKSEKMTHILPAALYGRQPKKFVIILLTPPRYIWRG